MAVRHGYGKIAGTDALTFAYDTGDTRNSYKGEPTTNLLPNGVAVGHNSGAYGNVVTVTDATVEKGPGWKKVTISNRGSNFRIIQWTYLSMSANIMYCHSAVFDWGNMRDKGYYINHDGNGTGQRFFYKPGDYTTNQGASISINSTLADGKIAGNITHTASHTHAFFINNNTTGVSGINDYFYYKEFQVEVNSHPTPYTTGTRSATQGLLDLTGNSTIDLTNLNGYDSNAKLVHDGTDDYIQINPFSLDVSNGLSYEVVYSAESTYNTWGTYHYLLRFVGTTHYGLLHEGDSRGWRFDVPTSAGARTGVTTNNTNATAGAGYYHVAVSYDPVTGGKGYLNGEQIGSWSGGYTAFTPSSLLIGAESTTTRFWDGEIPVVKIYNRALTAAEVRNNYNQYKGRFNI